MLDTGAPGGPCLRALRPAALPVSRMIVGKPVREAADLLPRLFNLCRAAQGTAARLAFGLLVPPEHTEALRLEILREHLIRICLKLPGHFGAGPVALPRDWPLAGDALRAAVFGPDGKMPDDCDGFERYLAEGGGLGRLLAQVRDCFGPHEAASAALPGMDAGNALCGGALENSVAGRQAPHPVLRMIERRMGRGPLWRTAARGYDAEACMNGLLPGLLVSGEGFAIVPAARGSYAVSASVAEGIVTGFRRVTPTDHLLAAGGVLDQALASLPAARAGMAPLLLDILDPCSPVRLEEVCHA